MKKVIGLIMASVFGAVLALGGYVFFIQDTQLLDNEKDDQNPRMVQTSYVATTKGSLDAAAVDFTKAAEETVNAVVHVKNKAMARMNPLAEFFYGEQKNSNEKAVVGAGSGVIISPDGYIVTNNHVIRNAEDIEIVLNNQKTYTAEVVGTHPRSDIALLKIKADKDLPFVPFGDSNAIQVGEWVLAVGNPFNLTSTVTAGIVSAKARNINVANRTNMIESFIQTDAAVNPGNSGGALVNIRGELVGINTAITSQTGSYVGYSFAVPSNIAKKVIDDLLEFGDVQTAYIGINYANLNSEQAKELDLNGTSQGVLITGISKNGGAQEAGLKKNDIIIKVDNVDVDKFADLQGFLSTKRPGNRVAIRVIRNGSEKEFDVKLKNQFGKLSVGKYDYTSFSLGSLNSVPKSLATKYKLNYGLQFDSSINDILVRQGVEKGDILLKINETKVYDQDDVESVLRKNKGKEISLTVLNNEGYAEFIRAFVQN